MGRKKGIPNREKRAKLTPEQRQNISEGMKKVYASGEHQPSALQRVAASEAMKRSHAEGKFDSHKRWETRRKNYGDQPYNRKPKCR